MRNKQDLLDLNDIAILYQYLYMSEDHFVIVNNGLADLKLYMDDNFNIMCLNLNYPDLSPMSYNDMLSISNLLGIIDFLKNDKEHIEIKNQFDSRWLEIKTITATTLVLNKQHLR